MQRSDAPSKAIDQSGIAHRLPSQRGQIGIKSTADTQGAIQQWAEHPSQVQPIHAPVDAGGVRQASGEIEVPSGLLRPHQGSDPKRFRPTSYQRQLREVGGGPDREEPIDDTG